MTIAPDDKDWTWVLERPCEDCGFDPSAIEVSDIGERTRSIARAWADLLASDGDVAERPDPVVWSPLEYAAHIRDVCRIMLARLNLMLVLDDPEFLNWDQDATAVSQAYGESDPLVVARELVAAASSIADAIDLVPVSTHGRTGRRSNGSVFTVATLTSYFLHDLVHHSHDVGLS